MNKSFNKFKEWFDTQDELEIVFTERRILSRIHKICGTVDAVFKNKKTGKHIVYDWKTSSGIRDSYFVQLYWYKMILCEMYDMEIDKGVIVNCTKQGKLKIAEFDIDSQCEDVALSSLKLYRFKPNKKEK
jgi:CRISPR/Cas system-associated exonuclease Cas4 (RecB family)